MRAKIKWRSDEAGRLVNGDEEFRHAFAKAEQDAARQPLIAVVTLDRGASLSIGLGREVSVLSYAGAAGNPPYFSGRGWVRGRAGEAWCSSTTGR
ncbi:hypothetical protein ACWKSP_40285 [Micromonosporaceae bacterium Da 78-11]